MPRIAVIGGGISGLSACHYVRRFIPSAQVSLFEKDSRYGGWIKTSQIPLSSNRSIPIESGPNSIRGGNDEKTVILAQLIRDVGLSDHVIGPSQDAKKSYLFYNNKTYEMKYIALKCLLSAMIWIPFHQCYYYMKGGHSNRYNDESIFDFFNRNFGEKVTNILGTTFVNGVYGGGIHHLSMKSCSPFNLIKEMEMEYGSYFVGAIARTRKKESQPNDLSDYRSFTFKHGLQQLIDALKNKLEMDENITLYNNFSVDNMRYSSDKECIQLCGDDKEFEFDHVLNAVQPPRCAAFLDSNYNLNEFNLSSSLITINMIFKKKEFVSDIMHKFKGIGVLFPRESDSLLGIIYSSSAFPPFDDSDIDVLSLVLMFGGPQFDVKSMTETQITTLCKSKLKQIYGIDVDDSNKTEIVCDSDTCNADEVFCIENEKYVNADVVYKINRLSQAISHYQVGHEHKLCKLRDHLTNVYHGKVSVIGSGYDGVGIHNCVMSAYQSVQKLTDIIDINSYKQADVL